MPVVLTLLPVLVNLLGTLFPAGGTVSTISSDVAAVLPNLIGAAQAEFALFQSGTPPTAAQQASIDAALDQANALLQAAQPGPPTA
jgi:hypothetical protein